MSASGRGLPVVDLSRPDEEAARAIDEACRDLGFFFLAGHGVADDLVSHVQQEALAFFDLPQAAKLAVARPSESVSRGYNRVGDQYHAATFAETADRGSPGDLQESFAIGPLDGDHGSVDAAFRRTAFAENLWPADRPEYRRALEAYYRAMEQLAERLMSLFARAVGLEPGFFAGKIDRHASILRLVHYPAQPEAPGPGQMRAGPHTDFGTLTILGTDGAPGLQVRDRNRAWIDVSAPPDSFVVNVGDLMSRWTNDRWTSSIHQVVNPPRQRADQRRLSLVFFHEPNPDTVVTCLPGCCVARYPAVMAAEHRRAKVAALRGVSREAC